MNRAVALSVAFDPAAGLEIIGNLAKNVVETAPFLAERARGLALQAGPA